MVSCTIIAQELHAIIAHETTALVSPRPKHTLDAQGYNMKQEGLAVASIARDDPSTLPGDDPFPRDRPHAPRPQCAVNWDRNLKPKLARPIMRQCTSVTDRRTLHKREMYILHLALKGENGHMTR